MSWKERARAELDRIAASGRTRSWRTLDGRGPRFTLDGRPVVSFASNDYLGLTGHPAVRDAAREALDRWGTGSGSARLIVGARPVHDELEAELAAWKRCERALVFSTGYMANLAVLRTLGTHGVTIFSDELNHASIVDGCRAAAASVVVYPHGDAGRLAELMRGAGPAIVVTDSVFSMDGDTAPLDEIAGLCRETGALLVVDEAHAVLDPQPCLAQPCLAPPWPEGVEALRVGTLSKTLAAIGGFVAGPEPLVELLANAARPFVFTTALPPADAAAALAALRVVRSDEGRALTDRLRGYVERIAPGHPSPIVPVVLGDERRALDAAGALLERRLLVPAIRPPSVPQGTSRLRVTLSAAHTDDEVHALAEALTGV